MDTEYIIKLMIQSLIVGIKLSAFPLISALIVGFLISIIQASTQINEMTLSFVPKIIAVLLSLFFCGHWMLNILLEYMQSIFMEIIYII